MKYVAFLDMLGFKKRLETLEQKDAMQFIRDFSVTIYKLWNETPVFNEYLSGYLVSDSLIINTKDAERESLAVMLEAVEKICLNIFTENSTLLRGAIAKGEFDRLEAREIKSLGKDLMVGQAYVDAYLLEGSVKIPGIVLANNVYNDIMETNQNDNSIIADKYSIVEEVAHNKKFHVFLYLKAEYFMLDNNLAKFVDLASKSGWLPHYYNALYFFLKNESSHSVFGIFESIIKMISQNTGQWREIDVFIKNTFDPNVVIDYQRRFLRFLRKKLC